MFNQQTTNARRSQSSPSFAINWDNEGEKKGGPMGKIKKKWEKKEKKEGAGMQARPDDATDHVQLNRGW